VGSRAGMTAMDGGNAIGLPGATLAHYTVASETFKNLCSMDTGSEPGMTKDGWYDSVLW